MQGKVVSIRQDKGYGFIRCDDDKRDCFFHCKVLRGVLFDDRLVHTRVEFSTTHDDAGRLRATEVRPASS